MGILVRQDRGKYWVVIHAGGVRRRKCIGPDKRAAEQVARDLRVALARGELGIVSVPESRMTIRQLSAQYLREAVHRYVQSGQLSESTARTREICLRLHVLPFLGDDDVRTLRPARVAEFLAWMAERDRPRSARSREIAMGTLRLLFEYGRSVEELGTNPVDQLKRSQPRGTRRRAAAMRRRESLDGEEIARLLELARLKSPTHHPLILWLCDSGCRLGEGLAMRWTNVNLEAGTALICESYSDSRFVGPTKSGRYRTIDLSTRLVAVLRGIQPERPRPDALVFGNEQGRLQNGNNFRARVFRPLCAEAFGPNRKLSPHCLRHSFASIHVAAGTPLPWIQRQGGWCNPNVLLGTYAHLIPDRSRTLADVVAGSGARARTSPADSPATPALGATDEPNFEDKES